MTVRLPTAPPPRGVSYRDVTIYRPFADEMPIDLVGRGASPDDVRVAKLDGTIVGAYRLARKPQARFEIEALAVYPAFRRVGIGRWLLGHALGIAESRGGRVVDGQGPAWLLAPAGFNRHGSGFRLVLTPE